MEKLKNGLQGAGVIALLVGMYTLPAVLATGSSDPAPEPEPTCIYESVPYEEVQEESSDYDVGYEEVTTDGEEGEREVCELDGEVLSSEITTEPVNEVTTIGTNEPEEEYEYPDYTYSERIGAICEDGSRSYATGSGACSWHGGVYEWLYR